MCVHIHLNLNNATAYIMSRRIAQDTHWHILINKKNHAVEFSPAHTGLIHKYAVFDFQHWTATNLII